MQTIKEILSSRLRAAFAAAFPEADLSALPLDAVPAAGESFGDYQCNAAMAASKILRQPPRAIAEQAAARLDASGLLSPGPRSPAPASSI
jgi:arginyl-tRNA synthetase